MIVTLYGKKKGKKKVFAGIIKLRILRWQGYPGLSSWALNAKYGYVREGEEILPINRRESNVITEAETNIMCPQAKECQ